MPPNRGRPAKPASSKQPKSAAVKRTKRSTTSNTDPSRKGPNAAQSDAEILKAFHLFAVPRGDVDDLDPDEDDGDADETVIKIADVRRCLSSLNLPKPPSDFFDDPSQTHLSVEEFLAIAQTLRDNTPTIDSSLLSSPQLSDEDNTTSDEVMHAFSLFTHDRQGDNIRITLKDLKRVAQELREEVDEATLKLMIEEANGEQGRDSVGRGVGLQEFEDIMKKAGVFG